ncbi:hypothetical protein ACOMHN_039671 [Nucella lapillus]
MVSLNLQRFRHGGVNITGFQLINHSSPYVRQFLHSWSGLEPSVWPGAGQHTLQYDSSIPQPEIITPDPSSAKHNDKIALTFGCITDIFLQLPVWDGAAISSTSITAFPLPLPGEECWHLQSARDRQEDTE